MRSIIKAAVVIFGIVMMMRFAVSRIPEQTQPTGKYKLPPEIQKAYNNTIAKAPAIPTTDAARPSAPIAPVAATGAPEHQLIAGIGFDGSFFYVANGMDFDWAEANVELEPGVFSSGWIAATGRVRTKSGVPIQAISFQKSNGARFNPSRDEASYARVIAQDKAGKVFRSRSIAIRAVR